MKNKVAIFGAGAYGKKALNLLKEKKEILCFVDNNFRVQGTFIDGIRVVSPEELKNIYSDEVSVAVCTEAYLTIGKQLNQMGITDYNVILDGDLFNVSAGEEKVRCTRCVMDNASDKYILFNDKGECNYCTKALKTKNSIYFPNTEGEKKLEELLREVKGDGRGKKYDCVMGVSGGLDSSYLLYLGAKWGLRTLAVHIDDGYDTEISKKNIDRLISATGVDYEVIKPDAEQYNALTLAYMKAGVPNIAIPQDNILFAFFYKKMKEYGIKYFLSGGNYALECILQKGNTHSSLDIANLKDIHNRYGTKNIDKLEFTSSEQMKIDKEEFGIQSPRPLNYIDYNRDRALKELHDFCGFEYYGRKHLENILTAFAQLYWLPKKFGVDKRTSHLSSMIMSDQMTREQAMAELEEPLYDENTMQGYIDIVCGNMGISRTELEEIMNSPAKSHEDYLCETV